MRFSVAVNVLLLCVATIVSALPIAHSTSSLELEGRDDFEVSDMFERDFDEAATVALYRRTKKTDWQIALHRHNPGTEKEHWALHIHPAGAGKNSGKWHVVDARIPEKAPSNSKLITVHDKKANYDPGLQKGKKGNHEHHILGKFHGNDNQAKILAESLKALQLTKEYPKENCVDWTKMAVNHLHAEQHITDEGHKLFTDIHDEHHEAVRKATAKKATA